MNLHSVTNQKLENSFFTFLNKNRENKINIFVKEQRCLFAFSSPVHLGAIP